MSKFVLLSNNFNKFSSYHGFQTSKLQAMKIFEVISEYAEGLEAGSVKLSSSDKVFFMQSAFSIFSLFTSSDVFFNHDQLIRMQSIQQ